jgi:predicted permease
MNGLLQDFRFSVRQLRKNLGFTAVAMLTLALGIGASAAVFSIVDAVLLRSLPYRDPERLVAVWDTEIGQPGTKIFAPFRDFQEFRSHNHSFETLAALTWARAGEILTWHGSPHQVLPIPASAEFFPLLGVSAETGRTFGPEDAGTGCRIVLAHSFWQTELSAPKDIVGATLVLNNKPCTVTGVMPRGFEFYPKQTSLWTLITPDGKFAQDPFNSVTGIFGRLKRGATAATAERELVGLHQRVAQEAPAGSWVAQITPMVRDLREQLTWMAGRNLRTALIVLCIAVAFLVLIACLNVANLLLARCGERTREFAVRAALGSGRPRLVRQLFTDSMLIAVLGTSFGVLVAIAGVRYFNSAKPVELPPGNQVTVNLRVLGFAILLTTVTGLLCGLIPAWRVSRVDVNEVLKQSGRSGVGEKQRTSHLLVVGQAALSMILLAGAGLTIDSLVRLGAVPLGFQPDHVLAAEVTLPATYAKLSQRSAFYHSALANVGALPGVEAVAFCSALGPYNGGESSEVTIAGEGTIENLEAVNRLQISGDYFRVLGMPLLEGRYFDIRDREGSLPVAIVNVQFVRKYLPNGNPIGRRIKLGKPNDEGPWVTIIGVSASEKRMSVYQEMGYVEPTLIYLPVSQAASTSMGLVMKTAGKPQAFNSLLQRAISNLDPNVPVYNVKTMSERYSDFLAHPRFRAILMGMLAGLTLLLAAIGFYGVLAQLVVQRTQEIGVRMALGAPRSHVLGMVVLRGGALALIGVCAGASAGLLLTRAMANLLYGVTADDPKTFVFAAALLICIALLACYIPARRAAQIDPMVALRYE